MPAASKKQEAVGTAGLGYSVTGRASASSFVCLAVWLPPLSSSEMIGRKRLWREGGALWEFSRSKIFREAGRSRCVFIEMCYQWHPSPYGSSLTFL